MMRFAQISSALAGMVAAQRHTSVTAQSQRRGMMESLADLETILREETDSPVDTYDASPSGEQSKSIPTDARIVGGQPVAAGTYPFFGHGSGALLCGATLIHEDIMLTAAHCDGAFLSGVLLGGLNLDGSDTVEFLEVDLELPSPDYVDATRVNDIMLVKLTNPSVAPLVNLNLDAAVPAEGDVLTITGFGDTTDGGDPSPVLLDVEVDSFSDESCDGLFTVYEPATMVCAGTVEGGRDSCQGDSGGPIFTADLVQVGVVSTGSGCGTPNLPAIYTEVAAFSTFIRQGICDLSDNPPDSCLDPTTAPTSAPVGGPTLAPAPVVGTAVPAPAVGTPTTATVSPGAPTPIAGGTEAPLSVTDAPAGSEPTAETEQPTTSTEAPVGLEPTADTEQPTTVTEAPVGLEPTVDTEEPTAMTESPIGVEPTADTEQPTPFTETPIGLETEQPTPTGEPLTLEPSFTLEPTRPKKPIKKGMMGMMGMRIYHGGKGGGKGRYKGKGIHGNKEGGKGGKGKIILGGYGGKGGGHRGYGGGKGSYGGKGVRGYLGRMGGRMGRRGFKGVKTAINGKAVAGRGNDVTNLVTGNLIFTNNAAQKHSTLSHIVRDGFVHAEPDVR